MPKNPADVETPLWHWAIRTTWLLQLSDEDARALVQIVEGLQRPIPRPTLQPQEHLLLAARDLHHCSIELEPLTSDPQTWIQSAMDGWRTLHDLWLPIRLAVMRPRLDRITTQLIGIAEKPLGKQDGMDPFRALLDACMPVEVVADLRAVGRRITGEGKENAIPLLVRNATGLLAAALACDLATVQGVLESLAPYIPGHTSALEDSAHALAAEIGGLGLFLPTEPPLRDALQLALSA